MILLKPYTVIEHITPGALQHIERAGRTCYKSEDRIGEGTAEVFANMLLARGHESVFEHASMTVRFICDRGVSHELVRHRIASFSQESTRYCDYGGNHTRFIIPPWVPVEEGEGYFSQDFELTPPSNGGRCWVQAMLDAEKHYHVVRNAGWRPEQARAVLPNSLKTEVVITANFREWREIFRQRTAAAAHPQMRELMVPLLREVQDRVPVVFDGILPAP